MWYRYFWMIFLVPLCSCSEETVPKPKGELRLEYPVATYKRLEAPCPFVFEISKHSEIKPSQKTLYWYNLSYKKMKANVFLTYFPIKNDFQLHVKEVEKMVYGHTVKASAIEQKTFSYPQKKVFGTFYELKGQSASNIQFFVTDSTKHFVTGNLYFRTHPKPDSLAPAIDYIKQDLLHLIDTFEWK